MYPRSGGAKWTSPAGTTATPGAPSSLRRDPVTAAELVENRCVNARLGAAALFDMQAGPRPGPARAYAQSPPTPAPAGSVVVLLPEDRLESERVHADGLEVWCCSGGLRRPFAPQSLANTVHPLAMAVCRRAHPTILRRRPVGFELSAAGPAPFWPRRTFGFGGPRRQRARRSPSRRIHRRVHGARRTADRINVIYNDGHRSATLLEWVHNPAEGTVSSSLLLTKASIRRHHHPPPPLETIGPATALRRGQIARESRGGLSGWSNPPLPHDTCTGAQIRLTSIRPELRRATTQAALDCRTPSFPPCLADTPRRCRRCGARMRPLYAWLGCFNTPPHRGLDGFARCWPAYN